MKTYIHKLDGSIEVKEQPKETDGDYTKVLEFEGGVIVTITKVTFEIEKRDFSKFEL